MGTNYDNRFFLPKAMIVENKIKSLTNWSLQVMGPPGQKILTWVGSSQFFDARVGSCQPPMNLGNFSPNIPNFFP